MRTLHLILAPFVLLKTLMQILQTIHIARIQLAQGVTRGFCASHCGVIRHPML